MSKRNYTHIQELLPTIQAMVAEGMTQREIAEHFGFKDKSVVKFALMRARKKGTPVQPFWLAVLPSRRLPTPRQLWVVSCSICCSSWLPLPVRICSVMLPSVNTSVCSSPTVLLLWLWLCMPGVVFPKRRSPLRTNLSVIFESRNDVCIPGFFFLKIARIKLRNWQNIFVKKSNSFLTIGEKPYIIFKPTDRP